MYFSFSYGSVIVDIALNVFPIGETSKDEETLLTTQQQIRTSLQAAIDDPQGPFADLQVQEGSLQVTLRKYGFRERCEKKPVDTCVGAAV